MKHIVVRPSGNGLSSVSILDSEASIPLPFESWALKNGKAIVWANVRMASLLKNSYVYGSFESKAVYTFTFDEMCAIVNSHVGPSDREAYELALQELSDVKRVEKSKPLYDKWQRWWYGSIVASEVAWTLLTTVGKVVGMLLKLLLVPLVIAFVRRPK
jgi:hypothetical protein